MAQRPLDLMGPRSILPQYLPCALREASAYITRQGEENGMGGSALAKDDRNHYRSKFTWRNQRISDVAAAAPNVHGYACFQE